MSRILITGGGGFIGCRLSDLLVAEGHDVTAADVLHPQVHPSQQRPVDLDPAVDLIPFDVTREEAWPALLRLTQPDAIVHLAAETGTGQSLSEASRHGLVNVVGTTRMLDALFKIDARPQHIVLTSSRAVYGDGAWVDESGGITYPGLRPHEALERGDWDHQGVAGEPMTAVPSTADVTETHPTNIYAATKLAQEHMLDAWCAATDTKLSILRLQNVYGPGQAIGNSYTGVLTFFASQVAEGLPIDVFEDGLIVRDFVYIADVANALKSALDAPPQSRRLLDIGSGRATTILEVAEAMARLGTGPAPVISGRFRDGDVRAASCSIDAAKADLGYEPRTTLEEGMELLLRWATGQRWE
jgi:dTDP-L-rhamnose 4-epimerase